MNPSQAEDGSIGAGHPAAVQTLIISGQVKNLRPTLSKTGGKYPGEK
jgi:hypothetical protein